VTNLISAIGRVCETIATRLNEFDRAIKCNRFIVTTSDDRISRTAVYERCATQLTCVHLSGSVCDGPAVDLNAKSMISGHAVNTYVGSVSLTDLHRRFAPLPVSISHRHHHCQYQRHAVVPAAVCHRALISSEWSERSFTDDNVH